MTNHIKVQGVILTLLLVLSSSMLSAQDIQMRDLSRTLSTDTQTLEDKRARVGFEAFHGNSEDIFHIIFNNRINGNQWEITATDKLGLTWSSFSLQPS